MQDPYVAVRPLRAAGRTRILIVDRKPLVRRGVRAVCAAEPDLEVCGEAESARAALDLVAELSPDLAVVELSLCDESGQPLIARLSSSCPAIALSVDYLNRGGGAGWPCTAHVTARGPDAITHLLSAIRARGAAAADRVCSDCNAFEDLETQAASLTSRELEVLALLSRGLGSRRIAETLRLSQKTVETHREHLKRKLGLRSASALIVWSVSWARSQSRAERSADVPADALPRHTPSLDASRVAEERPRSFAAVEA